MAESEGCVVTCPCPIEMGTSCAVRAVRRSPQSAATRSPTPASDLNSCLVARTKSRAYAGCPSWTSAEASLVS